MVYELEIGGVKIQRLRRLQGRQLTNDMVFCTLWEDKCKESALVLDAAICDLHASCQSLSSLEEFLEYNDDS